MRTEPDKLGGRAERRTAETPTVHVVDDDGAMRRSLRFLMRSAELPVTAYESAEQFLEHLHPAVRGCVVLDVRMPGMSGLELQEELRRRSVELPVIFLTAYADVPMAVRGMRAGAFDFIEKPFDDQTLLRRVRGAIEQESRQQTERQRREHALQCLQRLSDRERQVLGLVTSGHLNKQIAANLSISMKTVENHRANVMEKMEADSLADLVKMTLAAGIE